jgi:hypothetical protein
MTGHIRRRGERSWELKFDLGRNPVSGRRETRYRSFKGTKRKAQIELARLVAENAAGNSLDPSKETIAEFVQRWDCDWLSLNIGPKSLERNLGDEERNAIESAIAGVRAPINVAKKSGAAE